MGTWPRLDGAPRRTTPAEPAYDANRRKMAHFLGMDFLFTQREYCQSIQTVEDRKVLVNSSKQGEILAVRPVPKHLLDKVWFTKKFRFPRQYLGITKIDERVAKLSYLLHTVTTYGIPTRRCLKSLNRLSLIWHSVRFEDMRKHVQSITLEVIRSVGMTRNPWRTNQTVLSSYPRFTGVKIHESGIAAYLWQRSPCKGR